MRAFQLAKNKVKGKSKVSDDYIEKSEFRYLLIYLRQYFEYWVMFNRIDKEGNHKIDLSEFEKAIPEIEKWGIKIPDAKAAFDSIDNNHGGEIVFDEFCQWAIKKHLDLEDDDNFTEE